jgi:hypothetical protein
MQEHGGENDLLLHDHNYALQLLFGNPLFVKKMLHVVLQLLLKKHEICYKEEVLIAKLLN